MSSGSHAMEGKQWRRVVMRIEIKSIILSITSCQNIVFVVVEVIAVLTQRLFFKVGAFQGIFSRRPA